MPVRASTVTVDYAIVGGTGTGWATAPGSSDPADFAAASDPLSGELTFRYRVPGKVDVVERTVDVSLLNDEVVEVDEVLRLVLSNPAQAVLTDRDLLTDGVQAYGVGTITDIDPPWLIIDDVAQDEGLTLDVHGHGVQPPGGRDGDSGLRDRGSQRRSGPRLRCGVGHVDVQRLVATSNHGPRRPCAEPPESPRSPTPWECPLSPTPSRRPPRRRSTCC